MCAACVGQAPVEEVRADARTFLHGAFGKIVQSMQMQFAQEDHEMLVGRKLSVDWSLAPALLISDIVRGDPPSHWLAILDDAYGRSAALSISEDQIPCEVSDGCQLLRKGEAAIRFSYIAQRLFAAGAEVPAAIEWECDMRPTETIMRTLWYEPNLAQRGVDFPMPPDRTLLSWTDQLIRLRLLEESADWSMKWPTEAPIFDHVGDAYDLFDGLRAWHWARREKTDTNQSSATLLAGATEGSTARSILWNRISSDEWIVAISLRPCAALRRAGFTIQADGVDQSALPVGRPSVLVPIIAPNTIVTLSFSATHDSSPEIPLGTFLPKRLALVIDHQEVAYATLHSFAKHPTDEPHDISSQSWDSAWRDATLRIRQAQNSRDSPAPFDEQTLAVKATADSEKTLRRARLAANAWIFGMQGDTTRLMTTITQAAENRAQDGVKNLDLAAIQTFTESLVLGSAPNPVLHALRVRHALAASELESDELTRECLAATGAGRFWAALDVARAGVARAMAESPDEMIWKHACEQLNVWCANPLAHTVFGADPGVLLLSQRIANEMEVNAHSSAVEEAPTNTIGGRAAGGAHRELQRILNPLTQSHDE